MSSEVIRELFRNLETTLHDRLKVIEDILSLAKYSQVQTTTTQPSTAPEVTLKLQELENQFRSLDDYAMSQVRALAYNHDMLEKRVESMESAMKSTIESFKTINETIGSLQKRIDDEKPVEAAEVEAEIDETEEAALVVDEEQEEWCEHEQPKYKNGLECSACIEEKEEAVEEEEEEVEEEEAVEEEEEEEAVEEEELEFEEFTAKRGKKTRTYHRDQHNNVYLADEEGCIDPNEVLGIYTPKTKEVTWNS